MSKRTPKKKDSELYFEKYDLYSDANPHDTISVRYDNLDNLKKTIRKLERLYKRNEYTHARIVQVANVIKQRLRVIVNNTGKGINRYKKISKYFEFLTEERTPTKGDYYRKKLVFKV